MSQARRSRPAPGTLWGLGPPDGGPSPDLFPTTWLVARASEPRAFRHLSVPTTSKASTLMYFPAMFVGSHQILTVCVPAGRVPVFHTFC